MRTTYKLTNQTKKVAGRILHRIIALPGNKFVTAGTLGGWIEKEENLLDGAWVADDACVYGDAVVFGNTLIEDNSRVYGSAQIHGETDEILTLSFDTKVHGGDWTKGLVRRIGYFWTINPSSPNTVRIGCRDYSFEKWRKSFPAIIRVYRGEQINEKGVMECVNAYNEICRTYGKEAYSVDLNEVLAVWRREKARDDCRQYLNAEISAKAIKPARLCAISLIGGMGLTVPLLSNRIEMIT